MPLLKRYADHVGTITESDAFGELLLASRLDWALCDAPIEADLEGAEHTWLGRALRGDVPGLEVDPNWRMFETVHAGLFEVWPGATGAWLRDALAGLCVPLHEPIGLRPERGAPAALWDARIVIVDGAAQLCRPPLDVPLEVLPSVRKAVAMRFTEGAGRPSLLTIRKAWLQCQRQPRLSPRVTFARLLTGETPVSPRGRFPRPRVRR